jgi:hypothetical protein
MISSSPAKTRKLTDQERELLDVLRLSGVSLVEDFWLGISKRTEREQSERYAHFEQTIAPLIERGICQKMEMCEATYYRITPVEELTLADLAQRRAEKGEYNYS